MKYLFLLITLACTAPNEVQSKKLFVASHLEDCTGVGPQTCMLVKETPEAAWSYFYDQIEGFDYEEGFNYEILIDEIPVNNPPADASSLRFKLREIIAKTPDVDASELFKEWVVIKIEGLEKLSTSPTLTFQQEDEKLSGYAGCNNYFATYTVNDNVLNIGNAGATRMLCPDMSVEDTFLKTLPLVQRYEIKKKELYLYDQNDKVLIIAISK